MSSYLLAFVVGEFDFVEERDSNGVLIRVYAPVGKSTLGQFALDVRCSVIRLQLLRSSVGLTVLLLVSLCFVFIKCIFSLLELSLL